MKLLPFVLLLLSFLFFFQKPVFAIENPLERPNNPIGVHLLFPDEIIDAAKLINSNGGDWGYVTVPIQTGDKDLLKWQKFMNTAKSLHVIPLIRLATEGDYFNTKVWRKPQFSDVLDFANFLNSLDWPTKNRYIIVYNEVNRSDEWGGDVNPEEYAQILSYAATIFKSSNQDFFIISSGMDNAAATVPGLALNQYQYFAAMDAAVPGIFNQVDGIASHSYPNPGFSQPPSRVGKMGASSFVFEKAFIENMSSKKFPIFITETGWSKDVIPEAKSAAYYQEALATVWADKNIVAITPFLLKASGPFAVFSLTNTDNSFTLEYKAIQNAKKITGSPTLSTILGQHVQLAQPLPTKQFVDKNDIIPSASLSPEMKSIGKWLLRIQ